jgi:hypothetical protein
MYWYYEKGGTQAGPFTDEQFRKAVQSGEVQGNTLVWNETLSGWVPYKTIAAPQAQSFQPPPPPPAPINYQQALMQTCSQCSRSFDQGNMIQYSGLWICAACKPLFFQRLKEGGRSGGVWRDGKLLVATKGAVLPDRCVKCNAPARGIKITRKLYWHPPAYYVLICGGALLYVIVALIVRRTSILDLGICAEHKAKRKRGIIIGWSLVGASIALFIAGTSANEGALIAIGGLLFLAALIFAVIAAQFVVPRKMEPDGLVWLKGVNPAYLQELPAYQSF